jgi:hypothetical protein
MTFLRNSVLPLAVAGALTAAIPAAAGGIDSGSVAKIFPGQFEAKVKGYRVFFAGYNNGKLKGQAYGQQDEGRWYSKGGKLCVAWNDWTDGKAICGTISQRDGWYVATSSQGDVLKFRRTDVAMQ